MLIITTNRSPVIIPNHLTNRYFSRESMIETAFRQHLISIDSSKSLTKKVDDTD